MKHIRSSKYLDANNYILISTVDPEVAGAKFETAIFCTLYNMDEWCAVQEYNTKEDAEKGHMKWREIFSQKIFPEIIIDICSAFGDPRNKKYKLKRKYLIKQAEKTLYC